MNLFSTILSKFGVGALSNKDTGEQYSGPTSRSTEAGISVNDDRAMQVSAVWSCVRLISETVSSMPLTIHKRIGEKSQVAESDYHLSRIFNLSPNAFMTPLKFREAMTCQVCLWGNAYALVEWSDDKTRVISVTPLRPEHMTPVRTRSGITYHYATENGVAIYAQESIFHLKGFSLDGIVGLSPLAYARHTMGITVSADKFASKSFANGGKPGGVLTVDKFLTPAQRLEVAKIYEGISATADNANKLWVLEGGMGYQPISIPPDDMQMLETRSFQISEVARFWRVPNHLINDTEKSTSWGTGIEQLNLGFLQYTLQPYLDSWETEILDQLMPIKDKRKYYAEHDAEGLLRVDVKSRGEFLSSMVQNGIMDRNEARFKVKLPERSGASDLTAQVNLAPLDKLGEANANESEPSPTL